LEIGKKDVEKILGALYRHYEFLKLFMPKPTEGVSEMPRYTLTQLVDLTGGKDIGYLSKLTDKLEKIGLLEIHEEPRDRGGRPYKVSQLTPLALKILATIEESIKPREEKVEKLAESELWKIEWYMGKMDDLKLGEDLRYKFAYRFFELVSEDPVLALSKCEEVKKSFEDWVKNPPPVADRVGERKRATISVSMARLISSEETCGWVLSNLYPHIKKLLRRENQEDQKWAIGLLGDIGRLINSKREEIIEMLLNILFNEKTRIPEKEEEKSVANKIVHELIHILANLPTDERRKLLDELVDKARSDNKDIKDKAEWLLDKITTYL